MNQLTPGEVRSVPSNPLHKPHFVRRNVGQGDQQVADILHSQGQRRGVRSNKEPHSGTNERIGSTWTSCML